MIIDSTRTIHLLRDSVVPPPEAYKVIYTRFVNGSFGNRRDVVLPQPPDTVFTRENVDFLISGTRVHYVAHASSNSVRNFRAYYSLSTNSGTTFSAMTRIDSGETGCPALGLTAEGKVALLYGRLEQLPVPHAELKARFVGDSTVTISPPFASWSRWHYSCGQVLKSLRTQNFLIYPWYDSASGAGIAYYELNSSMTAVVDSFAFYQPIRPYDFAIDSLGGKYLVDAKEPPFRVFFSSRDVVTGVARGQNQFPTFELYQNFPNPFNPTTTIKYDITYPNGTKPRKARITLYDLLARRVAVLVDEVKEAGSYEIVWEPVGLSSGIYFARLEIGEATIATKRLVLIR